MKKVVTILTLLLVLASLVAAQAKPGGIARQIGLGGSSFGSGLVLNPFIIDDPAYMLFNPAYQTKYADYGWANIGAGQVYYPEYARQSATTSSSGEGYGMQNAGIAFGVTPDITLGTVLSYDHNLSGFNHLYDIAYISKRSSQSIPTISNVWELVGTYTMEKMQFGLGVMYGWSNNDYDSTGKEIYPNPFHAGDTTITKASAYEASANMLGFRAGMIYDLGEGDMFDVTAMLKLTNVTDDRSHTPKAQALTGNYSTSATEFLLGARGKMKVSEKFNFVPFGMAMFVSSEPSEDQAPYTTDTSYLTTKSYKVTANMLPLVSGRVPY